MSFVIHNISKGGIFSAFGLYFVALLFLLTGCKKDEPIVELSDEETNVDCVPLPSGGDIGFGETYILDSENKSSPCFNPNNPNEFCFIQSSQSGIVDLYTYDLITKSKTKIWSGIIWSPPKWGSNDWVIFGAHHNIFKIKSNGEGLTQLTFSNNCYFPEWYNEGENFICKYNYEIDNHTKGYAATFSSDGAILDTIKHYYSSRASINDDNVYVGVKQNYSNYIITLVDINNSTKTILNQINGNASFAWIDNSTFIWSHPQDGLNITSTLDGSTTIIREACNALYYSELNFDQSANKMICNKVYLERIDGSTIYYKVRLVIMNPDGTDEQEIDFSD